MAYKNVQLKNRYGDLLFPRTKVNLIVTEDGKPTQLATIDDLPTKLSQLENDTGFITKTVNDLLNYYLKDETYTKEEVDNLIASIKQLSYVIVDDNPELWSQEEMMAHLDEILLYKGLGQEYYTEYIVIDGGLGADPRYRVEKLGDTDIKLENYYTKQEVNTLISGFVSYELIQDEEE